MKGLLIFNFPQTLPQKALEPVLKAIVEQWPEWHLVLVPSQQDYSTAEFCACDIDEITIAPKIEFSSPVANGVKPKRKYVRHIK